MFHHLSLCTNLQNDVKSLISYRGINLTHNMLQFSCHRVQHTARSLLSRAGQGVNALQFGGAGSADFTLHATIYVTLRSDGKRAMTTRDIETVCSLRRKQSVHLSVKGCHQKKKNCRFKDKVPIGFNPPPLKLS